MASTWLMCHRGAIAQGSVSLESITSASVSVCRYHYMEQRGGVQGKATKPGAVPPLLWRSLNLERYQGG